MSSVDGDVEDPMTSRRMRVEQKKKFDEKMKEVFKPVKPSPGDVETKKFALVIQEKTVFFNDVRIGWVYTKNRIHLKNPTKHRYTYKVKCTNNEMFDIKAPMGFIDAGDSVDVEVFHCPGILIPESKWHHFSVYYIKCDSHALDYCPIWKSRKPEGCRHVPIKFPATRIQIEEKGMVVVEENEMAERKKLVKKLEVMQKMMNKKSRGAENATSAAATAEKKNNK